MYYNLNPISTDCVLTPHHNNILCVPRTITPVGITDNTVDDGRRSTKLADSNDGGICDNWGFSNFFESDDVVTLNSNPIGIKLSALRIINVNLADVPCKALLDTGAKITVIRDDIADKINAHVCGYVNLQGILGDPSCLCSQHW